MKAQKKLTKKHQKIRNEPILKVSNLTFCYPEQDSPILRNIDLKLYPKELRIVVGASGSGKSTLVNALCGFIPHSIEGDLSGNIILDGKDNYNRTIYQISQDISLVQQDPEAQLCTDDVFHEVAFALENFMVPPNQIKIRVRKVLSILGIQHLEHRQLHTLSGGEKQKVAIASMMVLRPKVLVFDEPTANLDPGSARAFIKMIDKLRAENQIGIIIVDHNPSQYSKIADHILVLKHGKIEHILSTHEFKKFNDEYYKKIFKLKQNNPIDGSHNQMLIDQQDKFEINVPTINILKNHKLDFNGSENNHKSLTSKKVNIKNINFNYGSKNVLKNINLSISPGEFIGIMGDNGSGKTTLIQNILGLLSPNSGVILYNLYSNGGNKKYNKKYKSTPALLAEKIGYVFQNPNHMIFGNTVWDEVMLGPRNFKQPKGKASKYAHGLLKLGELLKYRNTHPILLSHGEKRRLNLASILCYEPDIIMLDEPFIGQDPENISKILDYLLHFISLGKSVIMITHRAEIVNNFCTRMLFLKNGELVIDSVPGVAFKKLKQMGEKSYIPPILNTMGVDL